MDTTALNEIDVSEDTLQLSADLLDSRAFVLVTKAFQVAKPPLALSRPTVVRQDANLLIVDGTLPGLPGKPATVQVRLYVFEVPSKMSPDFVDRHCQILVKDLAGYTLDTLWRAFGIEGVVKLLTQPAFDEGSALLFSTLDYAGNPYDDPPFPADTSSLKPQDVTCGFTYRLRTALDKNGSVADGVTVETALEPLGLGGLASASPFTGQVKWDSLWDSQPQLVLWKAVSGNKLSFNGIPFPLQLTELGLAFPLQATGGGALTLPAFLLRGEISLGTSNPKSCLFAASFDPGSRMLQAAVSDLPSFGQIGESLKSSFDLKAAIAAFLPSEAGNLLDSLSVTELALWADLSQPALLAVQLGVAAGAPFSLAGVAQVTPALRVRIDDPLESYRTLDVDVSGLWQLGGAEIATTLSLENGVFTGLARMAAGSLSLADLAQEVLRGQVKGLPDLAVSSFDLLAQFHRDKPAEATFQIEADLEGDWHVGDFDLRLDNLTLEASFASGKLDAAALEAELDLGGAHFRLAAEYDADGESWTFSGGTDAADLNVGKLAEALAQDLGIEHPGTFLQDFESIEVTGFYLTYTASTARSASLDLYVGLEAGGKLAGTLPFDTLFLTCHTEGGAVRWQLDGTSTSNRNDCQTVLDYIKEATGVAVELPGSFTGLGLKGLSWCYDSATKDYFFAVHLAYGKDALLQVQVDLLSQVGGKGYRKEVGGRLILHPGSDTDQLIFDLSFEAAKEKHEFVAVFRSGSSRGLDLSTLLEAIDPGAAFSDGFHLDVRQALFAQGDGKWLFAVDMDAGVDLSGLGKLPLIGAALASAGSLTLGLQIVYAHGGTFTGHDLQALNRFGLADLRFPETDIQPGKPDVVTSLRLGSGAPIEMGLPLSVSRGNDGTLSHASDKEPFSPGGNPQTTGNDGTHWFPLKRSFGPVRFERVGLRYDKGKLEAFLDGSISLFGMTLSLLGLEMSVPLTGVTRFEPEFGLEGLGLQVDASPVAIGGALVRLQTGGVTEFDGFATVAFQPYLLGALGSFASLADGHDSLFVYAVLNAPLGGPEIFFVTGLAAGFGYNRRLLPPPIDQVQQFALIAEAMNPAPSPPPGDLAQVKDYVGGKLASMAEYIPPAVGEQFFAAGVRFTSFELVDSFVLAVVQLGRHVEVDVLGLSTAVLPPATTEAPLAETQMALRAVIDPAEGVVLVQGQLTPASYILSRDCHLTGGFAFASWFGGPHAGDFVVSLGGYAPAFKPPPHYPQVPRVGFNWTVSENLHVKGGGYFALVPHALMAGGSLAAVWSSDDVEACFHLSADFLLGWKPFHYQGDAYVDLSVEATIDFFGTHHVSFDASADLELWGPEFGGHARVAVEVIGIHFHFNIDFGASRSSPEAISWSDFSSSFLPPASKLLTVAIAGGLIRKAQDPTYGEIWIVKRDQLEIRTHSYFPVKDATFNGGNAGSSTAKAVGIAPMDISAVHASAHTITVKRKGSPVDDLTLSELPKEYPGGLWGHSMQRTLNPPAEEKVIQGLSGFAILPRKASNEDTGAIVVDRAALAYEPVTQDGYTRMASTGRFVPREGDWAHITKQIADTAVQRGGLLKDMGLGSLRESIRQPLARDTFFVPQYGTLED